MRRGSQCTEAACSRCGKELPTQEFYRRNDGYLSSWCKACYKADYQAKRPAKLEAARANAKAKPEYMRRKSRESGRRHRAKKTAAMRAWRKANPERSREHVRSRRRKMPPIAAELILGRFAVFGNRCAYCGREGPLEADHVKPIAKGGKHIPANIRPACRVCNASKAARPLKEWLADPTRLSGKAA